MNWTKGKRAGKIILAGGCCGLLLLMPEKAAEGVREGIRLSLETVIPALFPFMVLSGILIGGRGKGVERLLALPGQTAGAVLLGLIGGYPAGTMAAAGLVREGRISKEAGGRILCTGFLASPAFCSGIGRYLFGSGRIGLALWGCQLLAAILTGVICGRIFPPCPEKISARTSAPPAPFGDRFVGSVLGGIRGMAVVCGFTVLFSAIRSYLWMIPGGRYLLPFLEVSVGCISAKGLPFWKAVATVTLCCSLGGVSVWMQNAAFLRGSGIGMREFFLSRCIHLPLSLLITFGAEKCFHLSSWVSVSAFAAGIRVRPSEGNAAASVFLLAACTILLIGEQRLCYNKAAKQVSRTLPSFASQNSIR